MQQLIAAARLNAGAAASAADAMRDLKWAADDQTRIMQTQASAMAAVASGTHRSAMVAERALTGLERPYLFLTALQPIRNTMRTALPGVADAVDLLTEFATSYALHNWGRTPAIIKEINFGVAYMVELPAIPVYRDDPLTGEVIIGQNTTSKAYSVIPYRLTADDKQRIIDGVEDRGFFFLRLCQIRGCVR